MAKKKRNSKLFLAELAKVPIVTVAAEKAGVSRNSVYRWRKEDARFAGAMDQAMEEGEALVNDMSESQLMALIKEKNFSAIRYWLSHRSPKFKNKLEVTTKHEIDPTLTPEQEAVVASALQLADNIINQDGD